MLIDFNGQQERKAPVMNSGTGEMSAKMYMDDNGKIIPCRIHKGGSIGMHKHPTSDDINYIISGTGKAICDGEEVRWSLWHILSFILVHQKSSFCGKMV